jgi:ElaA protein
MPLDIKIVQDATDIASCFALRRAVFIDEQNVPEIEEIDGEDDHCTHILATLKGEPIGTARFQMKNGSVKIQRVCVSSSHRGQNHGAALIQFIVDYVEKRGIEKRLFLGSQTHAIPFYERLGFTAYGAEYMDAGIPHFDMERSLAN